MADGPRLEMPEAFGRRAREDPEFAAFVDRLPGLVAGLVADWELTRDGALLFGSCSLVAPVRTRDGEPAVLKVGLPHEEAEHEALALQRWDGDGAVRLLRADPRRWALLLERLRPGDLRPEDLSSIDADEACEVVAGLYARLHVPALPRLRRLSGYVARWSDRLAALPADAPVPPRLRDQAVSLGRAFTTDPGTDTSMIHGDLHDENVLAADREPWLAIDPKPVAGDPHYEVAPMLWNRWAEVVATGDVRTAVRRRFHTIVDTAGLDEERARDWAVVRTMHNVLWTLEDAVRDGVTLGADDREWVTISISIAKAVQD